MMKMFSLSVPSPMSLSLAPKGVSHSLLGGACKVKYASQVRRVLGTRDRDSTRPCTHPRLDSMAARI
jgi:hypothetical protein